jgi:hypothetical protein
VCCRPWFAVSMAEVRLCMFHQKVLGLIEAGQSEDTALLLDHHLGRARERLVVAMGSEAGPEADLPSSLVAE